MKKIIYIDLDDVIFDFTYSHLKALERIPTQPFPQSQYGFFANLEPKKNAVYSFFKLSNHFDVYFLTAPSVINPLCYTEKRISIEKNFGYSACEKLIIANNKSLFIGDYLIDDRTDSNKQSEFQGELIHFGSEKFPDWDVVVEYIFKKERI